MRYISYKNYLAFMFFLFIALPSSATIMVEGNFKAHVTNYQLIGSHSDFGSPKLGTEILAKFSYSIEENEIVTGPLEEPNMHTYVKKNWVDFDIYIGDENFNVPPRSNVQSSSGITIQKPTPDSWWDFLYMFEMTEAYREGHSPSDSNYISRDASVLLWGYVDDLSAAQDFSFDEDYDAKFYLGSSAYHNGSYYNESITAQISDFTIASRTVDVPEPSGILPSSLAFLFIGWRTFQSSRTK